ncbi:hypothetical protein ZYGR_0N02210 [Zygosaccharomyces rouxii]|uniref:Glutathione synthetase n=2 Tax=Zygosaccharomyces rouxii TaxID=4956 RepID=C5DVB6_ZYGRC|nr:uncharacterized protein ZYRO0D05390g [Zygosaccharomyces rouxii]KAH9200648.1 glutathione synthase [Zygosaccharomyces rouxii]GAV48816.1 hypothetical protein ZYGR_0N02210 [Zygosaccharomyces rouxii]CAR27735.1 ZYRO0D05390p [Zygosaccharomyces rouxii]
MASTETPNLSDDVIKRDLLPEIYQWSLSNGLIMYPPNFKLESVSVAPTTLYPTPVPRRSFQDAIAVQKAYNELYCNVSRDGNENWLTNESSKLAEFDSEFTGRLWGLYQKASKQGYSQKLRLGVFRSDYLIDKRHDEIKQVEFNTISVSFGGLSSKVGQLHNFLNDSGKYSPDRGSEFYSNEIPVSESAIKLADALATAVEHYEPRQPNPVVAFVVQDGERNVFDQRIVEYNLLQSHGIQTVRFTLEQVKTHTFLEPDSRRLYWKKSGQEIAVIWFRSAYSPADFKTEESWENRLILETSYAIKAPDLLIQLSGTKKIQQLLTNPDILAQFVPDESSRSQLLSTFVNIYPLDDSSLGREGKRLAFEQPFNYVLKPQREGGGNNIYKNDIPDALRKMDEKDWAAYILMELIQPEPNKKNVVLRGSEYYKEPILSELGIFGCVLFDESEIHYNQYSGWLLRSKFNSSNEGGVAAGFGCVDSLVLY